MGAFMGGRERQRWDGREGGEVEAKRTFRVELGVEIWVLRLEPFLAFLCSATEFTVLCDCIRSISCCPDVSCWRWLIYLWGKTADCGGVSE
jgi:hypothetical protein